MRCSKETHRRSRNRLRNNRPWFIFCCDSKIGNEGDCEATLMRFGIWFEVERGRGRFRSHSSMKRWMERGTSRRRQSGPAIGSIAPGTCLGAKTCCNVDQVFLWIPNRIWSKARTYQIEGFSFVTPAFDRWTCTSGGSLGGRAHSSLARTAD